MLSREEDVGVMRKRDAAALESLLTVGGPHADGHGGIAQTLDNFLPFAALDLGLETSSALALGEQRSY